MFSTKSRWIDLFEEELSIAQATGLEYIVMGDFNIDLHTCLARNPDGLTFLRKSSL